MNIWTAAEYAEQKRPVMVFIHGGSYGWGGTADPLYDGHNFVKAHPEVVLVTIAYRIGIAGFIDLSEVPGGETYTTSGNLGLLDQICALRYIRDNIGGFGGDPDNVTIFGESAGGGSVSLLPLIPEAKGLFARVIAESGSVALTYSRKECRNATERLLEETGAGNMRELLALSEEELRAAIGELEDDLNFPERDGVVIPEDLYGAYARGEAAPVPMIIGTNADEMRYWIREVGGWNRYRLMCRMQLESHLRRINRKDKKRVNAFFLTTDDNGRRNLTWRITEFFNELLFRLPAVRQAQDHAAQGNPVYMYYWKFPSSIPRMGACHAVELAYVFNNPEEIIYTGEGVDLALAAQVQQMWVNFARTGDPSTDEMTWERYTGASRKTMIFDKTVHMTLNLKERQRRLLAPLLEYYFNGNYEDLIPVKPLVGTALAAAAGAGLLLLRKIEEKQQE